MCCPRCGIAAASLMPDWLQKLRARLLCSLCCLASLVYRPCGSALTHLHWTVVPHAVQDKHPRFVRNQVAVIEERAAAAQAVEVRKWRLPAVETMSGCGQLRPLGSTLRQLSTLSARLASDLHH